MNLRWLPLLVACSPSAPPPATVAIPPAPTASTTVLPTATATPTARPTASGPSLDPATCARPQDPGYGQCKWTVALLGRCSGAAVPRDGAHVAAPTPTCVCNGCLADGDCTARPNGKCESFHLMCAPMAKACVYPGDPCASGGLVCERSPRPSTGPTMPMECAHDGRGHAVCGPQVYPPP